MKVAVLPFNAADGIKPALGRQFSAFAAEQLRAHADAEINAVSFLTQIQDEQGVQRVAYVNIQDELLPYEQIKDLFEQAEVELVMDGLLKGSEGDFDLLVRFHGKESEEPILQETISGPRSDVFSILHKLVKLLAQQSGTALPELLAGEKMEFGTEDPEAFLGFLEGYDSLGYIQQAQGAVALEFSPQGAIDALLASVEADKAFEGPFQVLIQLCRACAAYRIGTFEAVEQALTKLTTLRPNDFAPFMALGELYSTVNDHSRASEFYEKAIQREANDPGLYTRLGHAQAQVGMPVNAERNFRKAIEIGGEDRTPYNLLTEVLNGTGRGHEVPPLWKKVRDENIQDGEAWGSYAYALLQAGKEDEAIKVFDEGLTTLEDNTVLKRFYAPVLGQKGELDQAMDFFEDCIEVWPNDIPLLMQYVETLEKAGREPDLIDALKQVLASNPDPNTRAVAQARLIELEQPKRVETVMNAQAKMEQEDFEGALRDLKPLRNWLADYWKLWALLASANNRLEQWADAEDAATRLLNMYPGCEPAYGELAQALNGQDKHEDAYNLMRFAMENNPQSLGLAINFSLAAKRAGHVDEARALAKQIREAIAGDPNARDQIEPVLAEIER